MAENLFAAPAAAAEPDVPAPTADMDTLIAPTTEDVVDHDNWGDRLEADLRERENAERALLGEDPIPDPPPAAAAADPAPAPPSAVTMPEEVTNLISNQTQVLAESQRQNQALMQTLQGVLQGQNQPAPQQQTGLPAPAASHGR